MYLINGKEVKKDDFNISVEDLVVWRGDGIFEAIRIHGGFLYALDKHMERFKNSAKKMGNLGKSPKNHSKHPIWHPLQLSELRSNCGSSTSYHTELRTGSTGRYCSNRWKRS